MSRRPDASRPVSQSTADGLNDVSPADTFRGQEGQHTGPDHGDEISREQNSQQLSHQPAAQPPAQPYPSIAPGDSRTPGGASRGVGVHTMLNPTESATSSVHSTLGSNLQMAFVDRSLPQQTTRGEILPLISRLNHPPNSPGLLQTNAGFAGRRKRSLAPSAHRSVSLGNSAMAAQRPFVQPPPEHEAGWPHVVVPGTDASSEIPPVPAIPAHIRGPINLPPPVSGPSLNRRASVAVMGGPTARLPNSQSVSPNSPYSYSSHPSPAPITQMSQPPAGPPYFTGSTQRGAIPEGGPLQGSQQEPGPYMTLPQERIIIEALDVDVGSIEAANRRKRNADASARFRDRAKDKKKQESKEIQGRDKQIDYHKERSDFYRAERDKFWQMLYDNPATRSQALQERPQTPTAREPSPLSQVLPPGSRRQSPGGDMSQSERPARRRRLDDQREYERPGNQPRPEEGQHIQYPLPTNPYAPAQPRPEGGQHPQYLPPQTRSISGPVAGPSWLSNTSPQRPQSIFHPQSNSDRPWPNGQLPQPPQQQLQYPAQYQPQYQANHQANHRANHQAQQEMQQHAQQQAQQQQAQQQQAQQQVQRQAQQPQQPTPKPGDSSGQR
ncbi:hypothetical protein VF21_02599 [Pseudogymnoascus sp. 05NY08]|nr:hypothetical protein VF21_02599 [Pseudogymnoascus sp. 05NY08]